MTAGDLRLAALAAALVPRHAPGLLARAVAPEIAARGELLAQAPRAERLAALAAALATPPPASAQVEAAAARERPRIAALLRRAGRGAAAPPGVSPLLLRLVRERLS